MDQYKIIIAPVLTEKTNALRDSRKYFFKVAKNATKIDVIKAANALFSVNPIKCNIITVSPKPKRVRFRKGYTKSWKKAVITLSPGETIDIFEGV